MPVQENFTVKFKIARNYVIIRKFFNKAPSEIEAETGISKQNLSTWENEKGNPGQKFIDQLAEYFGLKREVFFMDDLTPEYLESMKNHAPVQNEPAVKENRTEEAARIYKELYEKFLGTNSQYLVIHRDILKEHRLISVEKIEEEKLQLANSQANIEQRSKEIQILTETIRDIAMRPINIQLPDVKRAEE